VGTRCPKCEGDLVARRSGLGRNTCECCGALWIPEGILASCIGAFLEQSGADARIVTLLERPGGPSAYHCPDCVESLTRVNLRGVAVERCDTCHHVLLEPGEAGLIFRRVLLTAAKVEDVPKRPRLSRLEARLRNHGRFGVAR
jgi:Zn-finger nucleic acid-binding protein